MTCDADHRSATPSEERQALLVVSFGGPEQPADVRPFLERVTAGRGVPADRLDEVEAHYRALGGRSPINDQVRALIAALRAELDRRGLDELPIYWGNRNWHPFLVDAIGQMRADGIERAFAFVTSACSSYSGCRQYREDIAAAVAAHGAGTVQVDKLRVYFDHPGFIEPAAERAQSGLDELLGADAGAGDVAVLFTAHSIPRSMAASCAYQAQLQAAADLVTARLEGRGATLRPELVWQSRSGPPQVPWLEPDVGERIVQLAASGVRRLLLVPIGFVSDHLEVVYDLDTVALDLAAAHGIRAVRAATVGTDHRFVAMAVDLLEERRAALAGLTPIRPALSELGVWPDTCRADCCPAPVRPSAASARSVTHAAPAGSTRQ